MVTAANTGIPPDASGARSTGPQHTVNSRTSISNLRRKLYNTPDYRRLTPRRADVISPSEKAPGRNDPETKKRPKNERRGFGAFLRAAHRKGRDLSVRRGGVPVGAALTKGCWPEGAGTRRAGGGEAAPRWGAGEGGAWCGPDSAARTAGAGG